MNGLAVMSVLLACAGACGMWKAISRMSRRTRCPQCGEAKLVIQPVERPDEATRLRCATCRAELVRDGDDLVDRAIYEASHPQRLPKAQLLERKDR